jgi:hypothetical protein
MGLDSNVYVVRTEFVIDDFSFQKSTDEESLRSMFYWRKHHDLHQWMKKLFIKKGGDFCLNQFNCEFIRLTLEDIQLLENDMEWYEEQPEAYNDDIRFIREAKIYLQDGYSLYFSSWY